MDKPLPIDQTSAIEALVSRTITKFHFVKEESRDKFRRLVGEAMHDLIEIERRAQIEAAEDRKRIAQQVRDKRVRAMATDHVHRVLTTVASLPNH